MSMDRVKLTLPLLFVTGLTLGKLHISNLKHAKKKINKTCQENPLSSAHNLEPGPWWNGD